jgi:hypothetical protein
MSKKTVTKRNIMKVYSLTIDTQPFYETKGKSHFERMIDWFESEGYNLTQYSVDNISQYIVRRKTIMNEMRELALLNNSK